MSLIFVSGWSNQLSAQDLMYPFEHYNEQNGITAPVRKILQDHFGFLWLASSDGLYRYDGKSFKVYRNKLGDTSSIPNNIINDLALHPNGQIWIASNGGLCYFSYDDNRFHQINLPENLEKTDRYRVHSLTIDCFGQVWFATKTKIHLVNSNNGLGKSFTLPLHSNFTISKIYLDSLQQLFIGTSLGDLIKIDLCTGNFLATQIRSIESIRLNLLTTITKIYPYKKDTIIITSWYGGLHKIGFSDTAIHALAIQNDLEGDLQKYVVTGIAKLRSDLWWVVTHGSGIFFFNPIKEKYYNQIKYNIANPGGLSDDYINDIYVDKTGIVWVATDDGINKYDRLSHQFFSLNIPNQKYEKSIYRRPSCILEDKKSEKNKYLWVSVPGIGLFHYDRYSHNFEYIQLKMVNKNQITDQLIYGMIYNHLDQMILCLSSGIYFFNEQNRDLIPFKFPENQKIENVRKILEDRMGNYWFSRASNGIYCFNPGENKLKHYFNQQNSDNSLPDNIVFCFMEDHENKIWIGTQSRGLCRLNPRDGNFLNFEHQKLQSRSLPDNNVYDLYEDPEHFLWVATENGLARMNPERSEFKIFTTSEGLSNNDIFFITPGVDGKLWMGSNNGISVLNPMDGSIINYTQKDGLPSSRLDGASMCCTDGYLYFGTNSMISGCDPSLILKNEEKPNVFITSIKVQGQEIPLYRSGMDLNSIHLNYGENNFNPEFVAMNFTNSSKNKYAYYLEGYDKQWNYCGSQSNTTYTNLPGGNYVFYVKGSNNDGVWSAYSDKLAIIVQPPFWNAWWFYTIVGLSIFAMVFFYFRIKIQQIFRLQQLRLEIARDLHDDVGSTLSSINMTSSMAEYLLKGGKNQIELFQFIQSASRKAMEMMNEIIWSIKPENDKPERMWSRMRQYASEILEPAGIEFNFNIDQKSEQLAIPLHIRKDLFMIFKEALNNQAKYSHATKSIISLVIDKSYLQLIIEDNGIGFSLDHLIKGNGLKNMEERAKAMGAKFNLESKTGQGTRIELNLKFKR